MSEPVASVGAASLHIGEGGSSLVTCSSSFTVDTAMSAGTMGPAILASVGAGSMRTTIIIARITLIVAIVGSASSAPIVGGVSFAIVRQTGSRIKHEGHHLLHLGLN